MEYIDKIWIIIPVCVVLAWQCYSLFLGSDSFDERKRVFQNGNFIKYEWRKVSSSDIDPLLGLHMIIVSLRGGVSIPRALAAVGSVLPGGKGLWLSNVSNALILGDTWHEAWSSPYVPECNGKTISTSSILAHWLMSSLRESWCCGSSPVPILSALAEHYERTMANVARQETSRLSVRLLLPVGLCFLPAFICIGILPTVASLMH